MSTSSREGNPHAWLNMGQSYLCLSDYGAVMLTPGWLWGCHTCVFLTMGPSCLCLCGYGTAMLMPSWLRKRHAYAFLIMGPSWLVQPIIISSYWFYNRRCCYAWLIMCLSCLCLADYAAVVHMSGWYSGRHTCAFLNMPPSCLCLTGYGTVILMSGWLWGHHAWASLIIEASYLCLAYLEAVMVMVGWLWDHPVYACIVKGEFAYILPVFGASYLCVTNYLLVRGAHVWLIRDRHACAWVVMWP